MKASARGPGLTRRLAALTPAGGALGPRREPSPRVLGLPRALPPEPGCSGGPRLRRGGPRGRRRGGPGAGGGEAPGRARQPRGLAASAPAWQRCRVPDRFPPPGGERGPARAAGQPRPAEPGGSVHLINGYRFSHRASPGTARVKCEQLWAWRRKATRPRPGRGRARAWACPASPVRRGAGSGRRRPPGSPLLSPLVRTKPANPRRCRGVTAPGLRERLKNCL